MEVTLGGLARSALCPRQGEGLCYVTHTHSSNEGCEEGWLLSCAFNVVFLTTCRPTSFHKGAEA